MASTDCHRQVIMSEDCEKQTQQQCSRQQQHPIGAAIHAAPFKQPTSLLPLLEAPLCCRWQSWESCGSAQVVGHVRGMCWAVGPLEKPSQRKITEGNVLGCEAIRKALPRGKPLRGTCWAVRPLEKPLPEENHGHMPLGEHELPLGCKALPLGHRAHFRYTV